METKRKQAKQLMMLELDDMNTILQKTIIKDPSKIVNPTIFLDLQPLIDKFRKDLVLPYDLYSRVGISYFSERLRGPFPGELLLVLPYLNQYVAQDMDSKEIQDIGAGYHELEHDMLVLFERLDVPEATVLVSKLVLLAHEIRELMFKHHVPFVESKDNPKWKFFPYIYIGKWDGLYLFSLPPVHYDHVKKDNPQRLDYHVYWRQHKQYQQWSKEVTEE